MIFHDLIGFPINSVLFRAPPCTSVGIFTRTNACFWPLQLLRVAGFVVCGPAFSLSSILSCQACSASLRELLGIQSWLPPWPGAAFPWVPAYLAVVCFLCTLVTPTHTSNLLLLLWLDVMLLENLPSGCPLFESVSQLRWTWEWVLLDNFLSDDDHLITVSSCKTFPECVV